MIEPTLEALTALHAFDATPWVNREGRLVAMQAALKAAADVRQTAALEAAWAGYNKARDA